MRETVKNTEKVSFKEARKYNYYYRLNSFFFFFFVFLFLIFLDFFFEWSASPGRHDTFLSDGTHSSRSSLVTETRNLVWRKPARLSTKTTLILFFYLSFFYRTKALLFFFFFVAGAKRSPLSTLEKHHDVIWASMTTFLPRPSYSQSKITHISLFFLHVRIYHLLVLSLIVRHIHFALFSFSCCCLFIFLTYACEFEFHSYLSLSLRPFEWICLLSMSLRSSGSLPFRFWKMPFFIKVPTLISVTKRICIHTSFWQNSWTFSFHLRQTVLY